MSATLRAWWEVEEAIKAGYDQEWLAHGYMSSGYRHSTLLLARGMYPHVMEEPVTGLEHRDLALSKVRLTALTFPHAPNPEESGDRDEVTIKVWNKLKGAVWKAASMKADAKLQNMVMAAGFVLCQTTLDGGAVYVTQDPECIEEDYQGSDIDAIRRAFRKGERQTEAIQKVLPEYAERFGKKIHGEIESSTNDMRERLGLPSPNGRRTTTR